MTKRALLSTVAGFALLSSFLLGCTLETVPSDKTQNREGTPTASDDGSKKTPSKNGSTTDPSTDGDDADPKAPPDDDGDNTVPSADMDALADMHWSTPNGVGGATFYDVQFSSDGTYRKQQIIFSGGSSLLHCEYGSWEAGSTAGKIALTSTCTGDSYEQTLSQNASGNLVLQGVTYSKDPSGVWNCAETECK